MTFTDLILLAVVLAFTFWLLKKTFFSKHANCGSCSESDCQLREIKNKISNKNNYNSKFQVDNDKKY